MSRKVCADNRPRVKGKFVKISSLTNLSNIAEEEKDTDEKKKDAEKKAKATEDTSDESGDSKASTDRAKEKEENANELIRDLREKALDAGLGAGKPLSRLRKSMANASAPNLQALADL